MDESKPPSKKLDIANIVDRTQYYSSEFKKMRCEVEQCGKYQPCRIFVKNTLAVEITMGAVKTQAATFRKKFRVDQHDKVLRKQQSLGLRLVKKSNYNAKISKLEYKIPSIGGLVTTSALTAVENKNSSVSKICCKISTSKFNLNRF